MPQAIESLGEEAWSGSGVFEVETVGVKFGEAGCGDDDAWGIFGLEDVEGEVEGFDEGLEIVRCTPGVDVIGVHTVVRRLSGALAKVTR